MLRAVSARLSSAASVANERICVDDEVFVEHHLPRTPQRLRDLVRLPLVTLGDRYHRQIVRRARRWHPQILHLGLYGHAYGGQEYLFGRLGYVGVLLRRHADHGGGVYRVAAMGYRRYVE